MKKSTARDPRQLSAALRCVAYDALILKWCVDDLHSPRERRANLPFGREEISFAAALIKFRVLYDFLSRPRNECRKTDIVVEDFDILPLRLSDQLREFRSSLDKFGAHLTYQRAEKDTKYPRPTHKQIAKHGVSLVSEVLKFVELRISDGVLLRGNGLRYYEQLQSQGS